MFAAVTLAIALSGAQAARLDPPPLASFDGAAWAGIRLGLATDAEIKRQFQTERGAVRPEALKLVTTRGAEVRVDALLDGRGSDAVVRALRVEYYRGGPTLEELAEAWQQQPESWFADERNEEWRLAVFRARGVIAIRVESGAEADRSVFLLGDPKAVDRALRGYVDEPGRITRPRDPGADWDGIVEFGNTSATLTLGSNRPTWMDQRWRDNFRADTEEEIEDLRRGALRFRRSSGGSVTVSVSTDRFSGESADWTVNASVSSSTPYGNFSASVSVQDRIRDRHLRRSMELVRDALDDLDREVRRRIREFGPPPADAQRKAQVVQLMADLTRRP